MSTQETFYTETLSQNLVLEVATVAKHFVPSVWLHALVPLCARGRNLCSFWTCFDKRKEQECWLRGIWKLMQIKPTAFWKRLSSLQQNTSSWQRTCWQHCNRAIIYSCVSLFCISDGSEQFARVQDGWWRIRVSLTWNYGAATSTRLAGWSWMEQLHCEARAWLTWLSKTPPPHPYPHPHPMMSSRTRAIVDIFDWIKCFWWWVALFSCLTFYWILVLVAD